MNTIKLNRQNLHELSASPGKCGFTRKQVELLGVTWPPKKGWLTSLIGKEISSELYEQVRSACRKKWIDKPLPIETEAGEGIIPVPIKGMTRRPFGLEWTHGADFVACVHWAGSNKEVTDRFHADTGLSLYDVIRATGINAMIDESTGYRSKVLIAFADWVCEKIWGEEPKH